jgi:hypothetical protein
MRPLVEVIDMVIKKGLVRSEWFGSLDPDERCFYPLLFYPGRSHCVFHVSREKKTGKKDSRRRA